MTTIDTNTALFDDVPDLERKVRSRDPETSWIAAAQITAAELVGLKADIHHILAARGPMTDDDLYDRYRAQGGTRTAQRVRTARAEMTNEYRGQSPTVRAGETTGSSHANNASRTWEVIR